MKIKSDSPCRRKFLLFLILFTLPLTPKLNAQSEAKTEVSGVVTDPNNEILIGVSIVEKGTTNGTVTDFNGNYSLQVSPKATLVFSYVGYTTEEIQVNNRKRINITLSDNQQIIEDVVVIGYGTMDKKELTSAISHISNKDFLNSSSVDPSMLIQGKIAGVSITNTGVSDPNNEASIQIRGISSRSAGLGPLIVIDGVPGGNLTNINANDIASMDILKDGAASAIYGTRGSNGVIVITTKKGSRDGRVHTTYNGSFTINKPLQELDLLSADKFRQYHIGDKGTLVDFGGNTNWMDELIKTGLTHQHTITLSGGDHKTNYRASVDYRNAEGIDLRSHREEYGGRLSLNHTVRSGLLSFSLNVAPRIVYRENAAWDAIKAAADANPTLPVFDTNTGSYYDMTNQLSGFNPVEKLKLEEDGSEIKLLDWDATANLNLLPLLAKESTSIHSLNTQIMFADQQSDNFNYFFRPSTSTLAIKQGYKGEASRSYKKYRQQTFEWLTNYGVDLQEHRLKLMGGYSHQYFQDSGMSAENKDFPSDALKYNNLETGEWANLEGKAGMSSYKNDSRLIAFFGRLSYNYKAKYMATVSLRYEGSSKFGENNKWGYFPAVSAGWRISDETFMKNMSWLDDLKIRADYGVTGNQNFDNYRSLSTMQGFGNYMYNGTWYTVWGQGRNPNYNLKWEKGHNWNIGLDFSVLKNRINGSFNYYQRKQQDLLGDYQVPVPPSVVETTFLNVGTMRNNGFEIDVNVQAVKTKNFSYDLTFVGATCTNKFLRFSSDEYTSTADNYMVNMEGPNTPGKLQRLEEGKRIGNFYTYRYAGIDSGGDWVVWSKNDEPIKISDATEEDKTITGNGLPKFTASLTQNFSYKDWTLSLFLRGAFGFDIFNVHDFYYGLPTMQGNVLQKAYTKNAAITAGSNVLSDYFIERGNYVKLDMITLSRTFRLKSRFIDSARILVTGKNLATFTGFSGVDPATYQTNGLTPGINTTSDGYGTRQYYPSATQIIIGVQLDF